MNDGIRQTLLPDIMKNLSTSRSPDVRSVPQVGRYAGIGLTVLAVAFAVGLIPRLHSRSAVLEASRELAVPTVTLVAPTPSHGGKSILLQAELRPLMESPIYARATGYVRRWTVDLGSRVTNGQVLVELDTPEVRQELATARAQLRQAEASAGLAKSTSARWKEMRSAALVSQQELEEKQAESDLKTAAVESARANVHRLEEMAGFAILTAPFDGIITARRLDVGQLISAGSGQELYRLAQTHQLRVYVRIPESLTRRVVVGQPGEVLIPSAPGRTFAARVVRTSGAMDSASRTLLTELELPNPEGLLFPGGFAQVRFPESHVEIPITIPANTLLFRSEGPVVGIVGSNNIVQLRPVVLGRDLGATVEVLGGVDSSDRLVLNPLDSLTEGTLVRVRN